jgi:tRNA nucleotidyltransferase/poly(A) polymerase
MKMYEVGGCVRDEILGVPSKDIDFSVVLEDSDMTIDPPFRIMVKELERMGFKIFLETPEFLTVRAQFPPSYDFSTFDANSNRPNWEQRKGLTADFVLARKEGEYTDGRRPDKVTPGTLEDDLARRDFTMNAIAKDVDGSYIDPFNGQADIAAGLIRAVGDPCERILEDALRAVRALRFSVTKGFTIEPVLSQTLMFETDIFNALREKISDQRIQEELSKMFRFDTTSSLGILNRYEGLTNAMFAGNVSLDATLKTKGRGK